MSLKLTVNHKNCINTSMPYTNTSCLSVPISHSPSLASSAVDNNLLEFEEYTSDLTQPL